MNISIKHYEALSKKELYDIMQLRNEVFVVEQNCPYQDIDGKDLQAYHLTVYDQDLVAYLRVLDAGLSFHEASIGRVLVKETHRKQDLGRLIMEKAIDYMRKKEMLPIKISAQAYLQKFYEGLGFVVCSDPYLEDDIPHIGMKLDF